MTFKAKVYRNETQAEYARNSPAGRRCRQQMVQGQLDSPACHHARRLDQIYNVYEFSADYDKVTLSCASYFLWKALSLNVSQDL